MSELPKVYKRLNNLFVENGYSLYMVGGTTRDFLLGKEIFDFDFPYSVATQESLLRKKIENSVKYYFVVLIFFAICQVFLLYVLCCRVI